MLSAVKTTLYFDALLRTNRGRTDRIRETLNTRILLLRTPISPIWRTSGSMSRRSLKNNPNWLPSPQGHDTQYPRRGLLREPTTDVATNHFKIDISDDATFYEYVFLDLPVGKSNTRLRSFIKEAINTIPFLKNSKHTHATDYINSVVSWGKTA